MGPGSLSTTPIRMSMIIIVDGKNFNYKIEIVSFFAHQNRYQKCASNQKKNNVFSVKVLIAFIINSGSGPLDTD